MFCTVLHDLDILYLAPALVALTIRRANTRRDEALKSKANKLSERNEQAPAIELKETLYRGRAKISSQSQCCLLKRMRRN